MERLKRNRVEIYGSFLFFFFSGLKQTVITSGIHVHA